MERPLPFVIERNQRLELNEEVLKIIEKSNNPRFLLFYGATRQGKSTTLNQLIRGNIETWSYVNKEPFLSQTSQKSLTMGCDIYGPVKCSEILYRHQQKKNLKNDFDIFFCDTEGLFSLNGQSKVLIPGILTLLQICTLSVIMINSVPNVNTVSQISSEIQFSKILQQINPELKSPLVAIYISGYQVDIVGIDDFDVCLSEYQKERDQTADDILKNFTDKYPHLNITKSDYKVIPGGPYEHNFNGEPNHNDLKARLYWDSIHQIINEFYVYSCRNPSYGALKLISLIRIVFDVFKEFKELPKDPDLSNVLIKYIGDIFNKYSIEQFEKINEEIKNELKNNYELYYNMLTDDNSARDKLNTCIDKNYIEIFKTLIPEKIKHFMENALLKLRKAIETQFENEFQLKCKEILSEEYLYSHSIDIQDEINKAFFQEEIDMNKVNNYTNIWTSIEKENDYLFLYFKSKKPKNIEILKNNFNNSIEKIISNLISKKIIWKEFFEEKKRMIQKEINFQYSELYRKIQFQEDFDKLIKTSEILSKELFEKYNQEYFTNLPNEKKIEFENWVKTECENEYNKLKEDNKKKPKWENICKNMIMMIKEKINNYMLTIFSGKQFKTEVDPNFGRTDIIKSKIPKEIIPNQDLSFNQQQEINNIINNQVNDAVIEFNKKREEMPSFEDFLLNEKGLYNKIVDEYIKEIMSQFYYAEDKIPLTADIIFSYIKKKQPKIISNNGLNKTLENAIDEISQNKAYEYNNILVPKSCPSWNKKKEEINQKLEDVYDKFYKKILNNKTYKEEVKYDLAELNKSIKSLNLFDGIKKNKHKEINDLIAEKEKEINRKISNKKNSLDSWTDKKQIIILEGINIMKEKSKTNLGTENLNEVIDKLVKYAMTHPRFLDPCKNENQKKEIENELKNKAVEISKNYIEKVQENRINEKKIKDAQEEARKAQLVIEQMQKAERERKEREERERREREERERREREERERREKEEIERKEREERERQYFPRTPYTGCSIVDGLKAINANSSYAYREQIAARNGIGGYVGSGQQNTHMLNLLKQGRLLRP